MHSGWGPWGHVLGLSAFCSSPDPLLGAQGFQMESAHRTTSLEVSPLPRLPGGTPVPTGKAPGDVQTPKSGEVSSLLNTFQRFPFTRRKKAKVFTMPWKALHGLASGHLWVPSQATHHTKPHWFLSLPLDTKLPLTGRVHLPFCLPEYPSPRVALLTAQMPLPSTTLRTAECTGKLTTAPRPPA